MAQAKATFPAKQPPLIAVGDGGTIVRSADGGITWTPQDSGTDADLTAVCSFGSPDNQPAFFAVGEHGTIVISLDGITWSPETSPVSVRLTAVGDAQSAGPLCALGDAGTSWLVRSAAGVWTRVAAPFADQPMRAMAGEVVVGKSGAVYVQETAGEEPGPLHQWRQVTVPTDADLEAVAIGPLSTIGRTPLTSLIAVGASGTILQQTNAGTWTSRESGTTETLRAVATKTGGNVALLVDTLRIGLGEFFAAGANGTILRSATGLTWMREVVPTQNDFNAITTTDDAVIAVGNDGTIFILDRTAGTPVITRPPAVAFEDGVNYLEADADGDGALSYLWVQYIPGGVPRFVGGGLRQMLPARPPVGVASPAYQLIVGNAFGIIRSEPIAPHRLANLSLLALCGRDESAVVARFSIAPGPSAVEHRILIRAVGPGLRGSGVADPLAAPRLTVSSGNRQLASNSGWLTGPNAGEIRHAELECGAFPLAEDSRDSAVLLSLTSGHYTIVVDSATDTPGSVLLELYDANASNTAPLLNLSARALVRPGNHATIAGIIVAGGLTKSVLVRVAGPALRQFGVAGALDRPRMVVRKGKAVLGIGGAWDDATNRAAIRRAAADVRAFPFAKGSADSALLVATGPGAHTIEVSSADGGTGVALVEIWELW